MKKLISLGLVLVIALISCMGTISFAEANTQTTATEVTDMNIKVDDVLSYPRGNDGKVAYPMIINGSSYLPLRALCNLLNIYVNWDATTRTVIINTKEPGFKPANNGGIKTANSSFKGTIAKDINIEVNGTITFPKNKDGSIAYPVIINGSTYLPVRAMGPLLGWFVDYDSTSRTILVDSENFVRYDKEGYIIERKANDSQRAAFEIPANNGKIKGTIGTINPLSDDQDVYDYYKLKVTGTGILKIHSTSPEDGTISYSLYSTDDVYIHGGDLSPEGEYSLELGIEDGTYYLLVSGFDSNTYKLETTFEKFAQDIEENDTYDKAITYKVGDTIKGLIGTIRGSYYDYNDCYFISDAATALNFELTSTQDTTISLYDSNQVYIGEYPTTRGSVTGTFEIDPEYNTAPYYVFISGNCDISEGPNTYTFKITK